jgi:hypothetical protein
MPFDEEKYRARLREQMHQQVREQGFETSAWDVEPGETCIRGTFEKRKRRWTTAPCGRPATIRLRLRTPDNPDGIEVPLCRGCLHQVAVGLLSYLVHVDKEDAT